MKKNKLLLITLLLMMNGTIACKNKTEKPEIRVAEVTHSIFYAPQYVSKNLGYFADEGIEVTFITTPGADKTTAALLSKDVDIGLMGPEASIYIEKNNAKDYVINFSKLTQKDGSFLLGRYEDPDFTFDKLKGKTIIGGRKGGMPEMVLEYVLKNAGLDVKQNDENAEVNIRTDVQFDVMAGVFTAGQSDYVALFEPSATAVVNNKIGHIVCSLGKESGIVPYTAYSALSSTINDKQDIIKKFNRAIKKGIDYVYTHDDEEIAKVIQKDFLSSSLDEIKTILKNYKTIKAYAENQKISKEEFEKLVSIIKMAGELEEDYIPPFEKLVTDKYL
jgi:ABC transporter, substrate-binding protein